MMKKKIALVSFLLVALVGCGSSDDVKKIIQQLKP